MSDAKMRPCSGLLDAVIDGTRVHAKELRFHVTDLMLLRSGDDGYKVVCSVQLEVVGENDEVLLALGPRNLGKGDTLHVARLDTMLAVNLVVER